MGCSLQSLCTEWWRSELQIGGTPSALHSTVPVGGNVSGVQDERAIVSAGGKSVIWWKCIVLVSSHVISLLGVILDKTFSP